MAVNHKEGSHISSISLETTVSKDQSKRNQVMIMCFGEMSNEALKYKPGDFVKVEGTLQSHEVKTMKGRDTVAQDIVAHSIIPAKSRLEEIAGDNYIGMKLYDKINDVLIAGEVNSVANRSNGVKALSLNSYVSGKIHSISVTLYENSFNAEFIKTIKKGDNVCVAGTIHTKLKDFGDGNRINFENFIGMEIVKLV